MAPYHILIPMFFPIFPENLVLLTESEQFGPKSAHICPTISTLVIFNVFFSVCGIKKVLVSSCLVSKTGVFHCQFAVNDDVNTIKDQKFKLTLQRMQNTIQASHVTVM